MTDSIRCGECGAPLNGLVDPPGGRAPCPHCGTTRRIYDVHLKEVISIVEVVTSARNPIAEAEALLEAIREVKSSGNFDPLANNDRWSALRERIPDTPKKLADYAAIVAVILMLLKAAPEVKIEINQAFYQQHELIIQHPEWFGIDDLVGPRVKRL